jgi:hypothetical protein
MPPKPRIVAKGHRNPRGFSASLMSDTKWRKLFTALDRPDLNLKQARIKFVDADKVHTINRPRAYGYGKKPWPYTDTIEFGPFALRSIEWIEFPAMAEFARSSPNGNGRVPATAEKQNIERAASILAGLGKFPIESVGGALRILGHVR